VLFSDHLDDAQHGRGVIAASSNEPKHHEPTQIDSTGGHAGISLTIPDYPIVRRNSRLAGALCRIQQ